MPTSTKLTPLAGINNKQEDAALMVYGDSPRVFLRDAVNVDITETGRLNMRGIPAQVSTVRYSNLWHSPLHGDLFGQLENEWVRINPQDWTCESLADVGGSWLSHCVVNGRVIAAGQNGIFAYNGQSATLLSILTPGQPFVSPNSTGSLAQGEYGVAVSWLRGTLESSVSAMTFEHIGESGGGLTIAAPYCLDPSVTQMRLYMTKPGSRELQFVSDYPVAGGAVGSVEVVTAKDLGASPEFQHLDAMPTGRFLKHWRSRLLTSSTKTLHFSEPMAWHLHDRRHGFVQFPQRITFVEPVDGGIWVGQVDHVVFLAGAQPDNLEIQRRAAKAPVFGSAALVEAELLGEMAGSGVHAALWLADNGYVIGTGDGQLVEVNRKHLSGIKAAAGHTSVWGDRILTVLG